MSVFSGVVTFFSRMMYIVSGVALACSMFLTATDVLLRSLRSPIVGTYEIVGLLGAITIGFAIPQTSRLNGHVIMDFFTSRLPQGLGWILHSMTRILGIIVFSVIGWNLLTFGGDFRRVGEVTPTLQIPLYPVAYGIAFCCFVECLVLIVQLSQWKGTQE